MAIGPPCHWRGRWRAPFLAGRVIRALNLPHRDGPVLGVDLNRYESIWLDRLTGGWPAACRKVLGRALSPALLQPLRNVVGGNGSSTASMAVPRRSNELPARQPSDFEPTGKPSRVSRFWTKSSSSCI